MGDICFKPKGSCPSCGSYKMDPERDTKACFARQDAKLRSNGNPLMEDYLTVISMDDTEKAQALYPQIFRKDR